MDLFNKYYSKIWQSIIRPPRQNYSRADLGPSNFQLNGQNYKRIDIVMRNKRKKYIECSFYKQKDQKQVLPVVVYLHGNSSSRLSAVQYLEHLLPDMNVFTVDMSGSGRSEGEYISLGYHEKEDVRAVVRYLREEHQVERIVLWGRSMGAATAILYAAKYQNVEGLILDSSFSDLENLIFEIADAQVSLPDFLVRYCLDNIREKIMEVMKEEEKYEFDIFKLKPISQISKINVPVFFMAGNDDKMVKNHHTVSLHKKCRSIDKHIEIFQGGHNGPRPLDTLLRVQGFLKKVFITKRKQSHQSYLAELDINTQFEALLENAKKIMSQNGKQHRQDKPRGENRKRIFPLCSPREQSQMEDL